MSQRPAIDLIDETFIRADPAHLVAIVCDEWHWAQLGMRLTCYEDRGVAGRRWRVDGPLSGTAEVWLEPFDDGTIVHVYLRADPDHGSRAWRHLERRWVTPLKHWVLQVKAEFDRRRPAGVLTPDPTEGPILSADSDEEI